jgi:hypothetical protein
MRRVRVVLAVAAFMCSACGGGSRSATVARSEEPIITQGSSSNSTRTHDPSESLNSPTAVPMVSAELPPLGSCPFSSADRLDRVVALAIDGLEDTTSEDGWSRACARVRAPDGSVEPYTVTVKIGWMGTLHEYSSVPGAQPIVGLADEAYELDDGRRIALRSGEIVAVVGYAGGTPSDTEALARQVAEQLLDS